MRILVDNGTYALENMGDVIMLQACVARLRAMWPGARVGVLTRKPERLARYIPDAEPVNALGRDHFVTPGSVLGKPHRVMPAAEQAMRVWAPELCGRVAGARLRRRNMDQGDVRGFVDSLRAADLLVTSGGGYITDAFPWLAERVLRTILLAQDLGKRTAMLGQGLGPITDGKLRSLATTALSRLDLLTLREGPSNLRLLASLGVPTDRTVVTGDDAIEAAYPPSAAAAASRTGIGVNLRVTRYAGADDQSVTALRPVLAAAAERHRTSLVPIPISYNDNAEDVRVLRSLLGQDVPDDEAVQFPAKTVAAAAACRVVITGSYHAAVFALSNGVPAIGLAASPYYVAKFEGLREQFDGGCTVVRFDEPSWRDNLATAIDRNWLHAEAFRLPLLAAAARQIESARAAYRRMAAWFTSPRTLPRSA